MSGPGRVNTTAFTHICGKQNIRMKRDKTKEQSEKVFLFKGALKCVLNSILKTLIKICLSAFLS